MSEPSLNLSADEIKHNLTLVLISVQDAVARRLRLMAPTPSPQRAAQWAAYKKDTELMENLINALESYS